MKSFFLFLLINTVLYAQPEFDDFFENKTLRIDYYHTGDSKNDFYSIHNLKEEPYWGGPKKNLIDPFNYGQYLFKVFDVSSNELIFSRSYATLFNEWQTTEEAKQTSKSFIESIVMPFPQDEIRVEFYGRDKKNNLIKKFEYFVDPEDYFISTERKHSYQMFEVLKSGEPENKVDIVILPEGYTQDEMENFKADCKKFSDYLFNSSPFKENKNRFNIYGIYAPSEEPGSDIPADDVWKKTILNSSFYTFNSDRYVMTEDFGTVRDIAANAPYDVICILVNSDKYGGGAIYNFYSMCINNSRYEEYIFVHEFGHLFASLADEYYTSDVAYSDFYPLDVEPLDPNLTTLVDFESKWKDMVDESTPIPTPPGDEYKNNLGAFEGGGYIAEGIYRPEFDCTMKSATKDNFCKVCAGAIKKMIDFYAD